MATSQLQAMASESPKVTPSVSNGGAGGVEIGPGPKILSPRPLVKRSSPSSASWRLSLNGTRILEVIVLSCIIIADWGLFLAPTIVYALPPLQSNTEEISINISFLCADNLDTRACLKTLTQNDTRTYTCAEGFFPENDSEIIVCTPLCNFWLSALELSPAEDIIFVISMFEAIAVSVILFIVALWFQRDTILVYPTFYLVYSCVTVTLVAPILIAGVLGKENVVCSSKSFLETVEKPTPFCTISGIAHSYLLLQITLWGTFHALGLFWGIAFPFHYRRFKAEGRVKYVHVITVVVGLTLPAIPALVPLVDGYTITLSPIDVCGGGNAAITYFTTILPISILMAASSTVLIILFWIIFKEFVIKKFQENQQRRHLNIGIAEVKIFIIACYYIILGCVGLSTFTYLIATDDETAAAFQDYFTCHSFGIVPGLDCGDIPNVRPQVFGTLASVTVILVDLIPLFNLIFTIKWTCKCFIKNGSYTSQKVSYASSKPAVDNYQ